MPEIVQDETVSETNPVKGEKINGASKESEELKENGSEKLAKNGHPEPSKESAVDTKIVDNGNSETSTTTEVTETTPTDEKSSVAESEKVDAAEVDKVKEDKVEDDKVEDDKEKVENDNKVEEIKTADEKKETVEVEDKVNKEEDKKEVSSSEVSCAEVEASDKAVVSEECSEDSASQKAEIKSCETIAADSSCEAETKKENVTESMPKEDNGVKTENNTDAKTEEAEAMEAESTTDTKETDETKETSPDKKLDSTTDSKDTEEIKETSLDKKLDSSEDPKDTEVVKETTPVKAASAGGSKHSDGDIPEDIDAMITEGRACMVKNNYNGAADLLGKACEKLSELFGEMDDKCAQCYYYYGCAMLECAKTENSVLGEGVNKEESESEDEEIPMVKEKEDGEEGETKADEEGKKEEDKKEEDNSNVNGDSSEGAEPSQDEPMETNDTGECEEDAKDDSESNEENTDITLNKEEEEEDTTLKAAWETLELAKFIFERQNNKKMLADTFMKLGEVAVESGHKTGFDDMKKCLELRSTFYGDNHRAIPETHFNIGLSYSLFELFDEAIEQFETSKDLLLKRIEMLENTKEDDAKNEINEIKGLLPDIDEKIKDMKESKEEKAKAEDTLKKKEEAGSSNAKATTDKTVSNLNHLVKRKRKIDEVAEALPEKEAKQACVEKETS